MFNNGNKRIVELENIIDHLRKENGRDRDSLIREYDQKLEDVQRSNKNALDDLELEHKLALKEEVFKLTHFKDEELKTAKDVNVKLSEEIAVVKKENEMLIKSVNLNADIIDVKELINKLVEKLPTINLNTLTLPAPTTK